VRISIPLSLYHVLNAAMSDLEEYTNSSERLQIRSATVQNLLNATNFGAYDLSRAGCVRRLEKCHFVDLKVARVFNIII